MKTKETKIFYLTHEEFDRDLDSCLLIINEPCRNRHYYVCEYTSETLEKSIVRIYIKKSR